MAGFGSRRFRLTDAECEARSIALRAELDRPETSKRRRSQIRTRLAYYANRDAKIAQQRGSTQGWHNYKGGCKKHGGIPMPLAEYNAFVAQPCISCGATPCGVDRIDSAVGYFSGNIQPMCWFCNRAKGSFSQAEFDAWVARLVAFRTGI